MIDILELAVVITTGLYAGFRVTSIRSDHDHRQNTRPRHSDRF